MSERLKMLIDSLPDGSTVTFTKQQLEELLKPVATKRDLSVAEVAALANRSQRSVRNWCEQGLLDGYRLRGAAWRIPRASWERFIEQQPSNGRRDV